MEFRKILQGLMIFSSLDSDEIAEIEKICTERRLEPGEVLAVEGEAGDEFYIVTEGILEVIVDRDDHPHSIVNLGMGQMIGEMSLVDFGPRSATVRAVTEKTTVQVIRRDHFESLCQKNSRIGYIVMRDVAADLAFKLRHRNLTAR